MAVSSASVMGDNPRGSLVTATSVVRIGVNNVTHVGSTGMTGNEAECGVAVTMMSAAGLFAMTTASGVVG